VEVDPDRPVLVDKYLDRAIELDVDALRDQQGNVVICGIMEHIEQVCGAAGARRCMAGGVAGAWRARACTGMPRRCARPRAGGVDGVAPHAARGGGLRVCRALGLLLTQRRAWRTTTPQAGVHSGDSACSIPTQSIPTTTLNTIREWTKQVAEALKVVGLINIQYAIQVCCCCCCSGGGGGGGGGVCCAAGFCHTSCGTGACGHMPRTPLPMH
jgi:hypothetical protein